MVPAHGFPSWVPPISVTATATVTLPLTVVSRATRGNNIIITSNLNLNLDNYKEYMTTS